ncbi:hypothetical protein [Desulfofundulus thermosubterraneus]|uniref:Uncharacterized protein n=1 Tax=Desulfofundulus thermosubterraneus DSM 16057 TaxID=1121432 RepID=A0A1M6EBD7_9FIRM|nr:hypothetical protein [Desulfofundulus thermosubterraneus]SHI82620.1 hypothetical protein SAMN02745219_01172 [Desulfofundulus thermosubterraneus DSM 16057]
MAGYPAHENAAKILENLKAALAKAGGDTGEKINEIISKLDPIKNNRTFMRTQKAEQVTEECLAESEKLLNNPEDAQALEKINNSVDFLVEKVRTMVIRMT